MAAVLTEEQLTWLRQHFPPMTFAGTRAFANHIDDQFKILWGFDLGDWFPPSPYRERPAEHPVISGTDLALTQFCAISPNTAETVLREKNLQLCGIIDTCFTLLDAVNASDYSGVVLEIEFNPRTARITRVWLDFPMAMEQGNTPVIGG